MSLGEITYYSNGERFTDTVLNRPLHQIETNIDYLLNGFDIYDIDLNTLIENGRYNLLGTVLNAPEGAELSFIEVISKGEKIIQIAQDVINMKTYVRYDINVGWELQGVGNGTVSAGNNATTYTLLERTATENQTIFYENYNPGMLEIYVDGNRLLPSEYKATDSIAIIFYEPLNEGDKVLFVIYQNINIAPGKTINNIEVKITEDYQQEFVIDYTVGFLDIFYNGIKLGKSDYAANNGKNITLAIPAEKGDLISFYIYDVIQFSNIYTKKQMDIELSSKRDISDSMSREEIKELLKLKRTNDSLLMSIIFGG